MLKLKLWKPCLDCPWLAEVVETESVVTCGHGKKVTENKTITCDHAPVCQRIANAVPLIGGAR